MIYLPYPGTSRNQGRSVCMYVRALYVLYLLYLLYLLLNYIASSHSTKFNVNTAARVADGICTRYVGRSTQLYVVS